MCRSTYSISRSSLGPRGCRGLGFTGSGVFRHRRTVFRAIPHLRSISRVEQPAPCISYIYFTSRAFNNLSAAPPRNFREDVLSFRRVNSILVISPFVKLAMIAASNCNVRRYQQSRTASILSTTTVCLLPQPAHQEAEPPRRRNYAQNHQEVNYLGTRRHFIGPRGCPGD